MRSFSDRVAVVTGVTIGGLASFDYAQDRSWQVGILPHEPAPAFAGLGADRIHVQNAMGGFLMRPIPPLSL
jgi:hypothetical protein